MNTKKSVQKIGVAIIEKDGSYLLGIRQAGTSLAGKAEFPGGKCNIGESIKDCLIRESLEETGLNIMPVEEFYHCKFSYVHAEVDLHFWICRLLKKEQETPDSHFWVTSSELKKYSFPEANLPVIEKLVVRNQDVQL